MNSIQIAIIVFLLASIAGSNFYLANRISEFKSYLSELDLQINYFRCDIAQLRNDVGDISRYNYEFCKYLKRVKEGDEK